MKHEIVMRDIETLIPYARNARTHSPAQVAQIMGSIKEFGFTAPVLIHGNGILAGHGRVQAARGLGMAQVPTIDLSHLTKTQARAYILADNQMAAKSGWEEEMLALELSELKDDGFDLDLLGFDNLMAMLNSLDPAEGGNDPDEHWQGMPEFENQDTCFKKIIVSIENETDLAAFFAAIDQDYTSKTKSVWFPKKEARDLESMRYQNAGDSNE